MNTSRLHFAKLAIAFSFYLLPVGYGNAGVEILSEENVSPSALSELSFLLTGDEIEINSNEHLDKAISEICDEGANESYRDLLIYPNPNLNIENINKRTTIVFPACVAGTIDENVKSGDLVVSDSEIARPKPEPVHYSYQNDLNGDAKFHRVASILRSEPIVASAYRPEIPKLTHIVAPSSVSRTADSCVGNLRNWPINAGQLRTTLQELRKRKGGGHAPQKATVVVVDNGLGRFGKKPFHESMFKLNREDILNNFEDDEGNGYADDFYGVNFVLGYGPPIPPNSYSHKDHGTHVTGLTLGGIFSEDLLEETSKRLRLRIVSLVGEVDGRIVNTQPQSLGVAFNYAFRDADIVNFSFYTNTQESGLRSVILANRDILVVAAAGNGGADLELVSVYPAAYGGGGIGNHSNVLTVAAHDKDGKLWHHSNYNKALLDVAAPGCDVPSFGNDGRVLSLSGTSQATPTVTLLAALLKSEGFDSPHRIKTRTIASVDYTKELQDKVFAKGKVSFEKALNFESDLIRLRSGSVVKGKIISRIPACLSHSRDYTYGRRILKHIYTTDVSFMLYEDRHRNLRFSSCDTPAGAITFQNNEQQETLVYPLTDVIEVIPAS